MRRQFRPPRLDPRATVSERPQQSPEETAVLVAHLFKTSEQKRARISAITIRRLAERRSIRVAFLRMLEDQLDILGYILIQLERDGYGLIPSSALDGAPAITIRKYLRDEMRKGFDLNRIRKSLEQDIKGDDDEDE